jgi:hypothetical protein
MYNNSSVIISMVRARFIPPSEFSADQMPDLLHTLEGHDLSFLKMVASTWRIELNAPDAATALPALTSALLSRPLIVEMLETLPEEAREALQVLLENEGRLPWSQFSRRFGEMRAMGPARRDRERPDLLPASTVEILWYRALIGKAIFNLPPEPQDYAYIPDDLVEYLYPLGAVRIAPIGRPASPAECAQPILASDRILDHACTLLAALRMNAEPQELNFPGLSITPLQLSELLRAAGFVDYKGFPLPDTVRTFLEAGRADALALLARSWVHSETFNDLLLLPGLKFEGDWINKPLLTRQAVLEMLSQLPQDTWWSLPAFIAGVRARRPDFQRPAGDYDSWFIRKEGSETFLRGFSSWDDIDGALLRFIITGPLHWLGILDLAAPDNHAAPSAFRPSAWAAALWHGNPPGGLPAEKAPIRVFSDGRLVLSNLTPRWVRYQLARMCQWEGTSGSEYRYRLAPSSLEQAQQQGLRPVHLITLLRKFAVGPLPAELLEALEHWDKFGVQANIEPVVLLRVSSPEILTALRKTRAARYLGETLSPTTILVKPGGSAALCSALAECGYLAEVSLNENEKL